MAEMDVDTPAAGQSAAKEQSSTVVTKGDKKRFEVKKVRSLGVLQIVKGLADMESLAAVECCCTVGVGCVGFIHGKRPGQLTLTSLSLSPDIVVDNCAICRNHIMDLCGF